MKRTHTFRLEAGEDKDEIVVEVWELVELLQFLSGSVKDSNTCSDIRKVYYNRLSCLYDGQLQMTTHHLVRISHSPHHTLITKHTRSHTHLRILLAQLFVSPCLVTASPSGAEALAADPVHQAATPS